MTTKVKKTDKNLLEETKGTEQSAESNVMTEITEQGEQQLTEEIVKAPEVIKEASPPITIIPEVGLSIEERVVKFIDERSNGKYIRLNDFLKSLYPIPVLGASPEWTKQGAMKVLKNLLEKLSNENRIIIPGNQHLKLGKNWYDGEARAQIYHLGNVNIEGKN